MRRARLVGFAISLLLAAPIFALGATKVLEASQDKGCMRIFHLFNAAPGFVLIVLGSMLVAGGAFSSLRS